MEKKCDVSAGKIWGGEREGASILYHLWDTSAVTAHDAHLIDLFNYVNNYFMEVKIVLTCAWKKNKQPMLLSPECTNVQYRIK